MTLFPKVVQQLRERGAGDIVVFGGGIIPADDIPTLGPAGIEKIFTPGANTGDIATWLLDGSPGRRPTSPAQTTTQGAPWICTSTKAKSCSAPRASPRRAGSWPRTGEQAAEATSELGGKSVVKVQVQVGGRGKGGGVALVDSPERAAEEANRMLGTDFQGMR